jgi:PadR family transcriptional regulator PadR
MGRCRTKAVILDPPPPTGVPVGIDITCATGIVSHRQTMGKLSRATPDLLPGTLDLLILRVVATEPTHGYGIAQRLKDLSQDVLHVGESSLYPALQRLLLNGYLDAEWAPSENNRRARYYTITKAGRAHLVAERTEFDLLVAAIHRVLKEA